MELLGSKGGGVGKNLKCSVSQPQTPIKLKKTSTIPTLTPTTSDKMNLETFL